MTVPQRMGSPLWWSSASVIAVPTVKPAMPPQKIDRAISTMGFSAPLRLMLTLPDERVSSSGAVAAAAWADGAKSSVRSSGAASDAALAPLAVELSATRTMKSLRSIGASGVRVPRGSDGTSAHIGN